MGEKLGDTSEAFCCFDRKIAFQGRFARCEEKVHAETVVLLTHQRGDEYIDIEIDLDELDATSAETKATYKQIQDWVQREYDFNVTNLNIAKVKQKHGIIERANYNHPKSEESRQPGCPKEKVKAIEDAMRYFRMI